MKKSWVYFSQYFQSDQKERYRLHLYFFRVMAVTVLALGFSYIYWRYTSSLNLAALWFAVPLVLAETYSLIDTLFFVIMMWKPARREKPVPIDGSVDVYITTYNEPLELVRLTAEAACRIEWENLNVFILDDGARHSMQEMAEELNCGYISRSEEWQGKPRHAKAGNINNALLQTSGEFILVLDADQIPHPAIIRKIIGYFDDPRLAFVQTPQYFYNLPPGDPFGSDAPLFYGPIMQGKDGWNAAFFCGSNALLRREALMQLGLTGYVQEVEKKFYQALSQIAIDLQKIQTNTPAYRNALDNFKNEIKKASQAVKKGESLETAASLVRKARANATQIISQQDIEDILSDLRTLGDSGDTASAQTGDFLSTHKNEILKKTSRLSSDESLGITPQTMDNLDFTQADEAIPVQAVATISITEDMATAMRLHAIGWHSVFHPEILAYGLAPEDLAAALSQRMRWAQGTIQVFLRENPLLKKGLSIPQKIQYFTTIYSYFSGFTSLIYLLAPIIYLFSGIPPVNAWSLEFAIRLVPFLLLNKALFNYASWGLSTWRGEQFYVALFPLWIKSIINVLTGAELKFVVTPKQRRSGNYLPLVWQQLLITSLTALACIYGLFSWLAGWNVQTTGIFVNIFWGCYNIILLSSIIKAAMYKPPLDWEARPPDFLFPDRPTGI